MIYDGNENFTTTIIAVIQAGLLFFTLMRLILIILIIWFPIFFFINTIVIFFLYSIICILLIVNTNKMMANNSENIPIEFFDIKILLKNIGSFPEFLMLTINTMGLIYGMVILLFRLDIGKLIANSLSLVSEVAQVAVL